MYKIKHSEGGKKYKRNSRNKIPRHEVIYGTTEEKVSKISVTFDSETGGIEFGQSMVKTVNQTLYERRSGKGPKILNQTPTISEEILFSSNESLLSNFELLFAIDTNTQRIESEVISVSSIIVGEITTDVKNAKTVINYSIPFCMEFMNVNKNPEKLAWKILVDHILIDDILRNIPRIGIIVDSDLANIASYNERKYPIICDFYLPGNVQLIYAAADGGSEYLANFLLQQSDDMSARVLKMMKAGKIPANEKVVQGKPYSSFRKIFSTQDHEVSPYQSLR
ncbi:hypothetical protein [Candidatus Nitrospira salsa]